jgi:hypothetical protein
MKYDLEDNYYNKCYTNNSNHSKYSAKYMSDTTLHVLTPKMQILLYLVFISNSAKKQI